MFTCVCVDSNPFLFTVFLVTIPRWWLCLCICAYENISQPAWAVNTLATVPMPILNTIWCVYIISLESRSHENHHQTKTDFPYDKYHTHHCHPIRTTIGYRLYYMQNEISLILNVAHGLFVRRVKGLIRTNCIPK